MAEPASAPGPEADLLSRVEDAGLNASAPSQQLWMDGWIVRTCPGKAKRARCINAVAPGRLPLAHKLARARALYDAAGLPLVVRITPFTQPPDLDERLAGQGWTLLDRTWVMVRNGLSDAAGEAGSLAPAGTVWAQLDGADYAKAVGAMRGSPPEQSRAHADRLATSPVRYEGHALRRASDGALLCCGQFAREGEVVGLYDVFTHPAARGQGLAHRLCARLLARAAAQGAQVAYLQVDEGNGPARRVYQRLGFADRYAYHYRQPPA